MNAPKVAQLIRPWAHNPKIQKVIYPILVGVFLIIIWQGLVTDPDLLLMDEPFGALDEITRHRLDAELLELWQKKKLTVIFVTHSIHEAVFLSNRVVMMAARPGRIVEEFAIPDPYPRTSDFMVSNAFSQHAKKLQDSLMRASAGQEAHFS